MRDFVLGRVRVPELSVQCDLAELRVSEGFACAGALCGFGGDESALLGSCLRFAVSEWMARAMRC